jgi:hypothetical protein
MTRVGSIELRPHNVRLICLACRTRLRIPGPWDGRLIAAFRAQHLRVVIAGWTVASVGNFVSEIEQPVPPAVHTHGS